ISFLSWRSSVHPPRSIRGRRRRGWRVEKNRKQHSQAELRDQEPSGGEEHHPVHGRGGSPQRLSEEDRVAAEAIEVLQGRESRDRRCDARDRRLQVRVQDLSEVRLRVEVLLPRDRGYERSRAEL